MLSCITGGSLGISTVIMLDAHLVKQPAHRIKTKSERALKKLNENWDSKITR